MGHSFDLQGEPLAAHHQLSRVCRRFWKAGLSAGQVTLRLIATGSQDKPNDAPENRGQGKGAPRVFANVGVSRLAKILCRLASLFLQVLKSVAEFFCSHNPKIAASQQIPMGQFPRFR